MELEAMEIAQKDIDKVRSIIEGSNRKTSGARQGFTLEWFQITYSNIDSLNFAPSPRYVIHAIGQWEHHIMNWRGCNYWGKKISPHPFASIGAAKEWLAEMVELGELTDGMHITGGSFRGDDPHPLDIGEEGWVPFSHISTSEEYIKPAEKEKAGT